MGDIGKRKTHCKVILRSFVGVTTQHMDYYKNFLYRRKQTISCFMLGQMIVFWMHHRTDLQEKMLLTLEKLNLKML